MKTIKRIIATTLALTFISTSTVLANDQPIRMTLDGQEITFPYQQPVIVDGRTLVPVRGVFEAMGFEVRWDGERQAVSMDNGEWSLDFVVGSPYPMTVLHSRYELPEEGPRPQPSVRFVDFEVRPQIINGSTMIPLRAIAESVGVEVDWDGATRTVSLGALEWTQTARQPEPTPALIPVEDYSRASVHDLLNAGYTLEEAHWIIGQEFLKLMNEGRASVGHPPVEWHDTVALAARLHSEDVVTNILPQTGRLSHEGSDGSTSSQRVQRLGIASSARENVATARSAYGVYSLWTNSPGHLATMRTVGFTHAGLGIYVGENGSTVITLKMVRLQ